MLHLIMSSHLYTIKTGIAWVKKFLSRNLTQKHLNLKLSIKLAYVFSAQDDSIPNFVVFRGTVCMKNWEDNIFRAVPLKSTTVTIKNDQNKGKRPTRNLKIVISVIYSMLLSVFEVLTKLCSNQNANLECQIDVSAHGGFAEPTTRFMIPNIMKALKSSRSKATYVTGHSLGGAMATITSGTGLKSFKWGH